MISSRDRARHLGFQRFGHFRLHRYGAAPRLITIVLTAGLLAAGCATAQQQAGSDGSATKQHRQSPVSAPPSTPTPPPPASVSANELGVVPVLMYHRITKEPSSVYDRTPKAFRAELIRLAKNDYVPVTAIEYATGNIDIPAGTHPVVLTFDDASESQFALTEAGEPVEGTAVDILLEVAQKHPQFRPVATFYVTTPPFGDADAKRELRWLHEHGFEIGNHTLTHANLGQSSSREVQRQIVAMQLKITKAVPDAQVRTMALPFGVSPDNDNLAVSGHFDGTSYRHQAVMLVGANPAPSPFSKEFDPAAVPRIRSQGKQGKGAKFGSTAWLNKLAAHPQRRYTSDGDPATISFPADTDRDITARFSDKANPY